MKKKREKKEKKKKPRGPRLVRVHRLFRPHSSVANPDSSGKDSEKGVYIVVAVWAVYGPVAEPT